MLDISQSHINAVVRSVALTAVVVQVEHALACGLVHLGQREVLPLVVEGRPAHGGDPLDHPGQLFVFDVPEGHRAIFGGGQELVLLGVHRDGGDFFGVVFELAQVAVVLEGVGSHVGVEGGIFAFGGQ